QGNAGKISIADPTEANLAIGTIDAALKIVSKQRADLGAYQNRFEMAAQGVAIAAENIQAAESRIRDANMASRMVDYTRDTILTQTGTAMLAQANLRNQAVLGLLG
ncbi:MAG: flagellin, partial [Treponema sp.]|nr:flagellin [Treponema sp.]